MLAKICIIFVFVQPYTYTLKEKKLAIHWLAITIRPTTGQMFDSFYKRLAQNSFKKPSRVAEWNLAEKLLELLSLLC